MAHRHQFYSYPLQQPSSAVTPTPPQPSQPQPPQKSGLSSVSDHYYPDTTFQFLARDGSEASSSYSSSSLGTLSSSSAMYHQLPNAATASHLAYPQLIQQQQEYQEAAWPPGVEVPSYASQTLPPCVKRTSEAAR